jgi:hypothetical protein
MSDQARKLAERIQALPSNTPWTEMTSTIENLLTAFESAAEQRGFERGVLMSARVADYAISKEFNRGWKEGNQMAPPRAEIVTKYVVRAIKSLSPTQAAPPPQGREPKGCPTPGACSCIEPAPTVTAVNVPQTMCSADIGKPNFRTFAPEPVASLSENEAVSVLLQGIPAYGTVSYACLEALVRSAFRGGAASELINTDPALRSRIESLEGALEAVPNLRLRISQRVIGED